MALRERGTWGTSFPRPEIHWEVELLTLDLPPAIRSTIFNATETDNPGQDARPRCGVDVMMRPATGCSCPGDRAD